MNVQANIPRPEHPWPHFERKEWLNLNGVWEFAETDDCEKSFLSGETYPDKIIVPFCRESKLSGLERQAEKVKNVWYRRTFTLPDGWKSPRTRLHIGASDWLTRVWLNGHFLGEHKGGSAPFNFEITHLLKSGENTVIVHVFDDIDSGLQPLGKQSSGESAGCFYSRVTGIWQTVWLEGLGQSFISDFHVEGDPDNSRIILQAEIDGPCKDLTIDVEAYADGELVGSGKAPADWRNNRFVIDLSKTRLWSPGDPYLYDLKLTLKRGDEVVDQVDSYFGLRTVTIQGAAILINGKPVFQRTVLDQGYYPDGIWTAPSDEALRRDVELALEAGFNGARIHQKVFEPRLLYWADKLGYFVWGEFPCCGPDYNNGQVYLPIIDEWVTVLRRDRNHPSIIGWCTFNETPPEVIPIQNTVMELTKLIDPSRPVMDTSHGSHGHPKPEILDTHDYEQDPETYKNMWTHAFAPDIALPERYHHGQLQRVIPFWVSEYGGIGWNIVDGWSYGNTPKTKEEVYSRYDGLTSALMDNRWIFGFCYTELTDVEQERNGVYDYERQPKFETERIREINARIAAYEKDPPIDVTQRSYDWKVLVGAYPDGELSREWRYAVEKPEGEWTALDFDDSAWSLGRGGFGKKRYWEAETRTEWDGKLIWLRQEFEYDGSSFDEALLVIHYDNAAEIFINGVRFGKLSAWYDGYLGFRITDFARKVLKPGRNVISILCSCYEGEHFIDAALLIS